jgi:hypothetical protein
MQDLHKPQFGIMRVAPFREFHRELQAGELQRRIREYTEEPSPRQGGPSEFRELFKPIRRGGLIVVEAEHGAGCARLEFNPDQPGAGTYEIRHEHALPEAGHTDCVEKVPPDERNPCFSTLINYPFRYYITTVSNDRGQHAKVWLIGLNSLPKPDYQE